MRLPRGVAFVAAALVVVATVVYSVGWMYYAGVEPRARLGIEPAHRVQSADVLVREVYPGTPAERAGLRPGDRILEINGRRLDTPNPFYDGVTRRRPGDAVRLLVQRGDAPPFTVDTTLAERLAPPPQRPARIIVLSLLRFYPAAFLIVAAVILLQRPQDRSAWLLALLFISLIAAAPVDEPVIHPSFRGFAVAFSMLGGLLPAALFYFFAVFPVRSPIDRKLPWLKHVLLASSLTVIAVLAVRVFRAESSAPVRRLAQSATWPFDLIFGVYWMFCVGLGLVSLVLNNIGAADSESRRKTRVIVWGMVVGLLPMAVLQTVSGILDVNPYDAAPFWIWSTAVLALFLIPVSFAYAVVKYRVLEIPVLLKRSARYLMVQRGFVLLLFILSAAATVVLAIELPALLPGRVGPAAPLGLIAGAGFGVALAWGGARLHRRFTARIDRAFFRHAYDARRILEDLAVRAGRAASRDELAAVLAQSTTDALHPASLAVYLERDGDTLESFHGTPPPELRRLPRRLPEIDAIARDGSPVVQLPPPNRNEPPGAFTALGTECVSVMFARDGRVAGLLALGPRLSEEPYSGEDRRLLAAVCNQAGLALDSIGLAERIAERLEAERRAAHELEIAKEVQRGLLPQQPPSLRSLECAGACLQARAVGGDYYDFLDLGEGRLGLVLADISGKGISAALLMATLQAFIRSRYSLAHDLPGLLRALNRSLFETSPSTRYATLFITRYEDDSGRIVYVNCGHNPPLIVRADGTADWLRPTAPVVGLFEEWSCELGERTLHAGDTLVLYTDGVTEAQDEDGEFFEADRLVALVQQHRRLAAPALLRTIVEEVTRFSGSVQEDDLTLVVARRLA